MKQMNQTSEVRVVPSNFAESTSIEIGDGYWISIDVSKYPGADAPKYAQDFIDVVASWKLAGRPAPEVVTLNRMIVEHIAETGSLPGLVDIVDQDGNPTGEQSLKKGLSRIGFRITYSLYGLCPICRKPDTLLIPSLSHAQVRNILVFNELKATYVSIATKKWSLKACSSVWWLDKKFATVTAKNAADITFEQALAFTGYPRHRYDVRICDACLPKMLKKAMVDGVEQRGKHAVELEKLRKELQKKRPARGPERDPK